jgi:hypothetical protein
MVRVGAMEPAFRARSPYYGPLRRHTVAVYGRCCWGRCDSAEKNNTSLPDYSPSHTQGDDNGPSARGLRSCVIQKSYLKHLYQLLEIAKIHGQCTSKPRDAASVDSPCTKWPLLALSSCGFSSSGLRRQSPPCAHASKNVTV